MSLRLGLFALLLSVAACTSPTAEELDWQVRQEGARSGIEPSAAVTILTRGMSEHAVNQALGSPTERVDNYVLARYGETLVLFKGGFVEAVMRNDGSPATASGEDAWSVTPSAPPVALTPAFAPPNSENGDLRGADNDRDGRTEPVFVNGYYRKDGTYVRSHYRARPRR